MSNRLIVVQLLYPLFVGGLVIVIMELPPPLNSSNMVMPLTPEVGDKALMMLCLLIRIDSDHLCVFPTLLR